MLIKSYGLYWSIDLVRWGRKGPGGASRLEGQSKDESTICDFWNDIGVYALYEEYRCVYIGRAVGVSLGQELSNRRWGRLAGRWDTFSWFGLSIPIRDPKRTAEAKALNKNLMIVSRPGQRNLQPGDIVEALEALTILLVNPPLNRRHEALKGAKEYDQVGQVERRTVRQLLGSIDQRLTSIEEQSDRGSKP